MDNRKKAQLKKALKPIVEEVIQEVLAEGSLVRSIITEAVKAAASQNQQVIVERHYTNGPSGFIPQQPINQPSYQHYQQPTQQPAQPDDAYQRRMEELRAEKQKQAEEMRDRLSKAAGIPEKAFSTLQPLMEGGEPDKASSTRAKANAGPLRDHNPNDPGLNIKGIMDLVGGPETWKSQL